MLDSTLINRFNGLVEVKYCERRKQFPMELSQIDSQAAARGMFNSSVRVLLQHQAHERELEIRTILGWESLVRVHRIFGCPTPETLRDDLKAEMQAQTQTVFAELSTSLEEHVKRSQPNMSVSLAEALRASLAKHEVEIDLYVDSLTNSQAGEGKHPMTQNYNFYGAVGSVQTGANSVANTVQNLGGDDRAALSAALQQVREAVVVATSVGEQQRRELIEIADDCATQISSEAPNNTKLLTMFNLLGTAIQSIASAQPAYQALKVALVPLGITLP